ncbi:hypothetical protein ACSTS3_10665 [Aquimarina muelleri]|uniref:hypothetical protein n=1 Tax=Aquimarina muelleri TaxID=279356 RepID=UPI003F682BE7
MKILKLILICTAFIGCAQTQKNSNTSNDTMKDIKPVPKTQQITYSIHINAKTPYEIFIDDIPLPGFGRWYESGMNATLELNPYLLSNGTHKLKVRYLPREDSKDSLVYPSDVYHTKDAKWNIFFVRYIKNGEEPLGYEGEIDYGNSELEVIPPSKPVPVWEQEFNLEIKDLPYTLKGWSESQDLSKMDQDKLKEQVFEYFNYLRIILHEGKVEEFIALNNIRDREIAIATYDDNLSWYHSEERKKEIIEDCKSNMWSINEKEYVMKTYAYGKIVSLERIDKFKNKGLIAETKSDYWYYSFKLHKPIGSNTFEIIRK